MPKLENFTARLEINGQSYAKNSLTYKPVSLDKVAVYYSQQPNRIIAEGVFSEWTDLNDTPYGSRALLEADLKSFLFDVVDQIESTTNSLKVVDYSHAEIHSGDHYLYLETHDIAKNETKDHLIVTPDSSRWAHMAIGVENITSTITVTLYEGTSVSDNGDMESSINRNRNVADNNTTLVYEDPTVISPGTELWTLSLGAGKNKSGGENRDASEIILKQNTNYLLRIVEPDVAATSINVSFDWYEHTNN